MGSETLVFGPQISWTGGLVIKDSSAVQLQKTQDFQLARGLYGVFYALAVCYSAVQLEAHLLQDNCSREKLGLGDFAALEIPRCLLSSNCMVVGLHAERMRLRTGFVFFLFSRSTNSIAI